MRLNRGTLALILLSVVAIAAVFLINRSPVNAPDTASETGTPTAAPGPLFASININTLNRLEVLEPETGAKTVLSRSVASALTSATVEFVPTEEVVVTAEAGATDEAAATDEITTTEEAASTSEASATEETASTAEVDATAEVSATEDLSLTEEAASTEEVPATDEVAAGTAEALPSPTLDPLIIPTATLDPNAPVWLISEVSNISDRAIDTTAAESAVLVFTSLQSVGSFAGENIANFGLDQPRYTLNATASDGTTFRVDVGVQNPTSPRYYVLLNGDQNTVYQVQADQLDALINLIATPPYVPAPTETLFPSNTPNPFSEVEQTQTAVIEGTNFALTLAAPTATLIPPLVSTPDASPNFSGASTEEADAATVEVVATEADAATADAATEEATATGG